MVRVVGSSPKGVLDVGGKKYRVKVIYDPYNKVWEARLTATQMRSVLKHVEKHGGWYISHRHVYDPNYDGIRVANSYEREWHPLTPAGLRQIIESDVNGKRKYARFYYLPRKGVFEVYYTWGKSYYLKPVKPIKIVLRK